MSTTPLFGICDKCGLEITGGAVWYVGVNGGKMFHTHCAPPMLQSKPEPDWRAIARGLGKAVQEFMMYGDERELEQAMKEWREAERSA